MKKSSVFMLILLLSLYLYAGCGSGINTVSSDSINNNFLPPSKDPLALPDSDSELGEYVKNRVIVHYGNNTDGKEIAGKINGTVIDSFTGNRENYALIEIPEGTSISETIKTLMEESGVSWAEPDYIYKFTSFTPDDPFYTLQYAPDSCNLDEAWAVTRGAGVKIAIIDSGINTSHEEFTGRIDGDSHGFTGEGIEDVHHHGTMVAGVAAASGNNGKGVAGVAWDSSIMVLNIFSNATGYESFYISSAVYWAVEKGAKVINMSLGSGYYSQIDADAISYALQNHVVVVASMGNEYINKVSYPAGFQGVIAVGAIDGRYEPAIYSTGGDHICVAAPGVNVYTTSIGGSDKYCYGSGTSSASPFVAGICALIFSAHPDFTPEQIKSQIELTAKDIESPGFDLKTGFGKPDGGAAVTGPVKDNKYGRVEVITGSGGNIRPKSTVLLYNSTGTLVKTTKSNIDGKAYFYYIPAPDEYKAVLYDPFGGSTAQSDLTPVTLYTGNGLYSTITINSITTSPLLEEHFDGNNFPPDGWSISNSIWNRISFPFAGGTDFNALAFAGESPFTGTSNLMSKSIDLSGTGAVTLYFRSYISNPVNVVAKVMISTDGGVNWTDLSWSPAVADVKENVEIDISAYRGNSDVKIAWYYEDNNSEFQNSWCIDDVYAGNFQTSPLLKK
ncbi:MAG: S8 family serine peptidase [Candidatus Eremiobacterota bacterium]